MEAHAKLNKNPSINGTRYLFCNLEDRHADTVISCNKRKQDAQLSQRDRAAVCIIVFAKSRTLELGDNDLRTL